MTMEKVRHSGILCSEAEQNIQNLLYSSIEVELKYVIYSQSRISDNSLSNFHNSYLLLHTILRRNKNQIQSRLYPICII